MSHPNEELLRSYFTAAERGDLGTLDELFADSIRAHVAGTHALAGEYQGKEAVFGFFGRLAERSGGTARLQLQDAVADDWFAVALVEAAGKVGGETLDGERAVLGPAGPGRQVR
jgi:ketosteroid isomerase-like protein